MAVAASGMLSVHESCPVCTPDPDVADIINTGDGYNFGYAEGVARPYWDIFKMWLAQNLHNVFFSECLKLGIPIQKV